MTTCPKKREFVYRAFAILHEQNYKGPDWGWPEREMVLWIAEGLYYEHFKEAELDIPEFWSNKDNPYRDAFIRVALDQYKSEVHTRGLRKDIHSYTEPLEDTHETTIFYF